MDYAVSSMLVKLERKEHKPIFYTSKVLFNADTRYSCFEKLIYAVIVSAHKLRPYFKSYTIEAVAAYPFRDVLHRPDLGG